MKHPSTKSSESTEKPSEQVLLLPGHLFFVESVEVPAGLENSEIESFAELSLESMAPFPLEQLFWGYIWSESSSHILIYAAQRERVKQFGISEVDPYAWVLPDFAPLAKATFPEATQILLESTHSSSLIQCEPGLDAPSKVTSTADAGNKNGTTTDSSDSSSLLKQTAEDYKVLRIRTVSVELNEESIPTFNFESVNGSSSDSNYGKWTSLTPDEIFLWRADIRSALFKKAEKAERRTTALISKVMLWACFFFVFLIIAEFTLVLGNLWKKQKLELIASQDTLVRTIEDKQTLMNKLDQVSQNELRPIALLGALNEVRKKQNIGVHFKSTIIEDENVITVEGIAQTINELNRYVGLLQNSAQFELVEPPTSKTRAGKTQFSVKLSYKHTPSTAVTEPSQPSSEIVVDQAPQTRVQL